MKELTFVRNKLITEQFKNGVSKEELARKHDLGLTYISTILRECGLIKSKPRQDLAKRNHKILQMFKEGKTPEVIAANMKLTITRIRQILTTDYTKANEKKVLLEAKEKAIELIAIGRNVKEIENVIGIQAVKRLKYRFNFSVSKMVIKRRAERVVELYKEGSQPTEISKKLGCTYDYVYRLLRAAGVNLNLFSDSKRERDKSIYAYIKKGGTPTQAAKKWNLSVAMIKIVYKKISEQTGKVN